MINKFRYKKPPKNNCSLENKSDTGIVMKCDIKDKVELIQDKNDINRGPVFSRTLDKDTKRKITELFSQLQFSTETALPPDALRRALAESFFDQNRFQLGFMDDAAECFENMLLRIHTHIAHGEAEDMCNAKHCIPHQKFAMTLVEQSVCGSCGATSEPLSYTQMVHYVSTSTLVYQVRTNAGRPNPPDTFGQLLQKAGSMGDVRTCPSACGAVIQIGRTLMNHPEIVSVGLVWNSERPTLEHIMEVFSTLGTTLRLGDVFNTVVDSRWAEMSLHNLVGVVTYYGKHYSTFFFHTKLRVWIYFDDATVREVGPRWDQVVEKCRKGRYQPLLLLYALPDGTPVNTENAPKQVTPFYNDKTNKKLPSQATIRRSITPSPEKPMIGNTRRAITPNPEGSALNQKPPLPRPYNEYQNLSIIQKNIYSSQPVPDTDVVDGCISQKDPEYVTRKSLEFEKPQINVHRTLSNGSSSGIEGMCIPEHLNIPRRRDSGNWSGDRNSASSASSTTMENPYLYLIGKVPHGNGSVPSSPTRIKSDSSSGSSGIYDAGYDSYSLSSNDSSSMSTLQHLMKMGHLAKIPEDYNNPNTASQPSQSCDVLCDEADELLVKSRQLEDEHDLVLALALCNAAATKARAAMNAPYNNPQTLTLARMKHNTCIMRARSLHRRMTQTQIFQNKENPPEIRHTREGSSGSGRHSRQNSRDKGQHSRQNSRELLVQEKEKPKSTKNIEIYATLPKKKDSLKAKMNAINIEDEEYILYDKPPGRESRSIFSKSKNKDCQKTKEKRSRSEDRNKMVRDFSIAPEILTAKDTLKKAKEEKETEEKKEKEGKTKKQHKIRRKLLMGGLIKRKNRSMPDLTDANTDSGNNPKPPPPTSTVDDSNLGLKGVPENKNGMCGYLSEGHLEFTGNNANPNLERSKLMRKSFHGSAGKILTAAKVPPPPPLRTTSQLSKSKLNSGEVGEENNERPKYPLPNEMNHYQNSQQYRFENMSPSYNNQASISLPYYHNSSCDDESYFNTTNTVITHAEVHHEQSPIKSPNVDSGVDEVDCLPSHTQQMLELPPYPSPIGSVIHSRQASEDFPPPPPPLDLSALEEHLPRPPPPPTPPRSDGLLAQLQNKRQQILSQDNDGLKTSFPTIKISGDTWLKELQAKQAALRIKKCDNNQNEDNGVDEVNTQRYLPEDAKIKSVKDLASKFENPDTAVGPKQITTQPQQNINNFDIAKSVHNPGVLSIKRREEVEPIAAEQIAEEIREVEMLSAAVNKTLNSATLESEENKKNKLGKKKSVSFCDQVILVATAEEQEDDSYIPNPILERVLRSAVNKPETAAIRQEIMILRENEMRKQDTTISVNEPASDVLQQPLYTRRNSLENLLSRHSFIEPVGGQNPQVQQPYCQNQLQQSLPHNFANEQNFCPSSVQNSHILNGSTSVYTTQNQLQSCYGHNVQFNGHVAPTQNLQDDVQNAQYVRQSDIGMYNKQISSNDLQYKQQYHQAPAYQFTPSLYNGNIGYQNPNLQYVMNNTQQANNHYVEQTASRQSPYQPIPSNSHAYAAYYANSRTNTPTVQNKTQDYIPQTYTTSPRNIYSQQMLQIRQSTPSPMAYSHSPVHHHAPSPAPPTASTNYTYHPSMYLGSNNNFDGCQFSPYQRIPLSADYQQNYDSNDNDGLQNVVHQKIPQQPYQERPDIYQRVPPPHSEPDMSQTYQLSGKYSPYQHILPSKQILKKTVSFEPGTKGGKESPTPKAIVTPIIVNNANNSVPTDKTKCNLCRKKNVIASNLYCTDCEFYMSRFKPRS